MGNKLDSIFGTATAKSTTKSGFQPPKHIMANSDLARIINSDEVQSAVRPAKANDAKFVLKKNPLKNLGAMVKLNPYALTMRRAELLRQEAVANKSKLWQPDVQQNALSKRSMLPGQRNSTAIC